MINEYYANGKILITGEYLVLRGATALAVPLKLQQSLSVNNNDNSNLLWTAFDEEGEWFNAEFNAENLLPLKANDHQKALYLQKLLKKAIELNSDFKTTLTGKSVKTNLQWNINWGFGSSSSLIALIAQWAKIDAHLLHTKVSKGSGYDLACALSDKPLLFTLNENIPIIKDAGFYPDFAENIFLVYLGNKMNSALEVNRFNESVITNQNDIREISEISCMMCKTKSLDEFCRLMSIHENILGKLLKITPVKNRLFPDFDGEIKSLGAWGGDFVMAASKNNDKFIKKYFKGKGYHTIFAWKLIVK